MVVAIPTIRESEDSAIDPRFGRANLFALFDSSSGKLVETLQNPYAGARGGAGIQVCQMLINKGVKAVVVTQIGPNSMSMLQSAGVKIFSAPAGVTAKQAFDSFVKGELEEITEIKRR